MLGLLALTSRTMAGTTDDEIQHLLQYVRESEVTFIRNGQEYKSADAADHLMTKMEHFKKQIVAAEDFIRLAGTKSIMSGKVYQIKTKDGKLQESGKWLSDELSRYRAQKRELGQQGDGD